MKKLEIEDCAVSGIELDGVDVARRERSPGLYRESGRPIPRQSIVLRHAWPEHGDARVWDGVMRAARGWALRIVNDPRERERGVKSVGIYSYHGDMIDCIDRDGWGAL